MIRFIEINSLLQLCDIRNKIQYYKEYINDLYNQSCEIPDNIVKDNWLVLDFSDNKVKEL